jgi:hypothetical protein
MELGGRLVVYILSYGLREGGVGNAGKKYVYNLSILVK